MSEDPTPYNSTKTSSGEKDSSSPKTGHGTNLPLLIWIDWRPESTPNKREHWSKKHQRHAKARLAVKKAIEGKDPPKLSLQ